jgi:hypothetical protein
MTSRREQLDQQRNPTPATTRYRCACGAYTGPAPVDLVDNAGHHTAFACAQMALPAACACGRVKRDAGGWPATRYNSIGKTLHDLPAAGGCWQLVKETGGKLWRKDYWLA